MEYRLLYCTDVSFKVLLSARIIKTVPIQHMPLEVDLCAAHLSSVRHKSDVGAAVVRAGAGVSSL